MNPTEPTHNPYDLSILLVEPEPLLRQSQVDLLDNLGYEDVVQTTHGKHALKTLFRGGIDLALTASNLPDMNGVDLLRALRTDQRTFTLPVIMVVETITTEEVLQAGRAGVNEIILLPLSLTKLRGKIISALDALEEPQSAQARLRFQEGLEMIQEGRYEEALETFQGVMAVYENAEVYYNLGYIRTAQERFDEAIRYFRKATEIDSTYAQAYRQMAKCYERLGDQARAQKYAQKAAEIFLEKDMEDTAEEMYLEVVRMNPETINVYNSLGILYRKRGQYELALQQYQKALKVNPTDENIMYNLARAYWDINNSKEAVNLLKSALHARPDFHEAGRLLEHIQNQSGAH